MIYLWLIPSIVILSVLFINSIGARTSAKFTLFGTEYYNPKLIVTALIICSLIPILNIILLISIAHETQITK